MKYLLILILVFNAYSKKYLVKETSYGVPLKNFLDKVLLETARINYSAPSEVLSSPYYGSLEGVFTRSELIGAIKSLMRTQGLQVYTGISQVLIIDKFGNEFYKDLVTKTEIIELPYPIYNPETFSNYQNDDLKISYSVGSKLIQAKGTLTEIKRFKEFISTLSNQFQNFRIEMQIFEVISDSIIDIGFKYNQPIPLTKKPSEILSIYAQESLTEINSISKPLLIMGSRDSSSLFIGTAKGYDNTIINEFATQTEKVFKEFGLSIDLNSNQLNDSVISFSINMVASDFVSLDEENKSNYQVTFNAQLEELYNLTSLSRLIEKDEVVKIPFISAIPFFGELFKYKRKQNYYQTYLIQFKVVEA